MRQSTVILPVCLLPMCRYWKDDAVYCAAGLGPSRLQIHQLTCSVALYNQAAICSLSKR